MKMILVGPPGAGKGTQAQILRDKYKIPHISTGDLFRALKPDSELGKKVRSFTEAGKLVPDEITIGMIGDRLSQPDCKNGFILDGFPRNVVQAEALEKMLKEKGIKLDGLVQIEVDDDKLVERIAGRFSCSDCGEGYHDKFKMPHDPHACDKCHAVDKFTRRPDDNEKVLRERLAVYHTQTEPILPFYESRGMLKKVNGMASMEEVTQQIEAVLKGDQACDKPNCPPSAAKGGKRP